jgi:hypothetical protein
MMVVPMAMSVHYWKRDMSRVFVEYAPEVSAATVLYVFPVLLVGKCSWYCVGAGFTISELEQDPYDRVNVSVAMCSLEAPCFVRHLPL